MYVFVPLQIGSAEITGPVGVRFVPQASVTVGGVGTMILATQVAVPVVGAIAAKSERVMVTVCT